jgi:hypothetical protein
MRNLGIIPWGKVSVLSVLYFIINEKQRILYSPYHTLKTKVLDAQLVTPVRTEAMCKIFANFQLWIGVLKWKLCARNKHNSVKRVNVHVVSLLIIYRHLTLNVMIHV